MRVLGIADNHASGATLVQDGKIAFAVNQERIDRTKNSGAFPVGAIDAVLTAAGIGPGDVDKIALASDITPTAILRLLKPFHFRLKQSAGQFSPLYNAYVIYQAGVRKFFPPFYALDRWLSKKIVGSQMRKLGFQCELETVEHHDAHAYSVFLTSPFEQATVITADAMGDGVSVTVGIGKAGGTVERLFEQSGATALNPYYSRTTEYLGFKPNRHEGKITGLAAYGDPKKLLPLYNRYMHFVGPGFSCMNLATDYRKDRGLYRALEGHSREDIAAALQRNLEIEVKKFVAHWVRRTGIGDVCLAGGIFENVKLNQRIHEIPEVDNIYIFPNMSDGGLSAGAALVKAGASRSRIDNVYFGPEITDDAIAAAIQESGLPFTTPKNPAEKVGALLAEGQIVCRFDGRMEFGPRALGHRSVLSQATDPAVNDWLNAMLKRSEFMPFAPAVMDEDAALCFKETDGARHTARFMNICFDCHPVLTEGCPGVVHVDGTARPQLVHRDQDPVYYDIIRHYKKRSGLPAIINTSFNMHEEPIVATPAEGIKAFLDGGFSYMLIGKHLVTRRAG